MTKEQIQYAKDNYPIGTEYICASEGFTYIIKGDSTTYRDAGNQIYGDYAKGCLYSAGKWAEIISLPIEKKELIINNYQIF